MPICMHNDSTFCVGGTPELVSWAYKKPRRLVQHSARIAVGKYPELIRRRVPWGSFQERWKIIMVIHHSGGGGGGGQTLLEIGYGLRKEMRMVIRKHQVVGLSSPFYRTPKSPNTQAGNRSHVACHPSPVTCQ